MRPVDNMLNGGIGVAFFDFGIAAHPNNKLIEFQDHRSLPDDCIWVTDLTDEILGNRYPGRARFKSDLYFQRRLLTLIRDLGLQDLGPREKVQVLQGILGWSYDLKDEFVGQMNPISDRFISVPRTGLTQRHLKPVLTSAGQRYCQLQPVKQQVSPFLLYSIPSDFYKRIARYQYPASNFRMVEKSSIDTSSLLEQGSPIAFVRLSNPTDIEQILSATFWNMAGRVMDNGSLWLSLPEYQYAAQWAGQPFQVDQAISALEYSSLQELYPLEETGARVRAKRLIQEQLSYSIFVLYDSLLGAHLGYGVKTLTFSESYLSSIARILLIEDVRKLQSMGYEVQGYGAGRIALSEHPVLMPVARRSEFLQLACELKLMIPATDFGVPFQETPDNNFSVLFAMASQGDSRGIVELNHYSLEAE